MKAAIFSNHSPRVGFGVDRKMAVSRSQVMVVAASRNHLYRRRLQVVIDAGPRNHLYLLGQQVKIRSSPRNQFTRVPKRLHAALTGGVCVCAGRGSTVEARGREVLHIAAKL